VSGDALLSKAKAFVILVFRVSGFGFMVQVEGFRFRVQG
jgi:hypothetical protein